MILLLLLSGARKSLEKDEGVPAVSGAAQYAKAKTVPLAKSRTSNDSQAPWFENGNKLAKMPTRPKERPTKAKLTKPGGKGVKRGQKVSKGTAASTGSNTIPKAVMDEDEDEAELPELS